MSGGIFISYRRDDAKHAAGRLVDRLGRSFSREQLFFDIDNIEPGLDFKKVLSQRVQACNVLLAVIGPEWLNSKAENGERRLDDPRDFVRVEIEAALTRDVRVIPVLVDGARMPRENELPEAIRGLTYRNAVRLTHERFASDAEDLAEALSRIVETPAPREFKRGSKRARATHHGAPGIIIAVSSGTQRVRIAIRYGSPFRRDGHAINRQDARSDYSVVRRGGSVGILATLGF